MHCPACAHENPAEAKQCSACGARLTRSRRRETEAPPLEETTPSLALIALRCALWGMIPGAGLILGPAALLLGILAWRREPVATDTRTRARALAAMILGGAVFLTNAVGLTLIYIGLFGSSV